MLRHHRLTSYIEVLDENANQYNKYAICLACIELNSHSYALEKQFTNTKKCCKDHFKKCDFFKQKHGKNEAQTILNDTDNETTIRKRQRVYKKDCKYNYFDLNLNYLLII